MPRKAKEKAVESDVEKKGKNTSAKASDVKKKPVVKSSTSTKSGSTEKKPTAKKSASNTSSATKTKKVANKKYEINPTAKKSTSAKKTSASRTKTTKKSSFNVDINVEESKKYIAEYYDLPYKYNKTMVKLLAQTPNTLFVYWEISDEDRLKFIDTYGKDFFNKTRPVLLVHNRDFNYSYEVPINDFANSWYIKINDSKSNYEVELGRRPNDVMHSDYVYITSSNSIEAPNDHMLFDRLGNSVFFRNVKTNRVEKRNLSSLSFMRRIGKLYNIKDIYSLLYKEELNEFSDKFDLTNPSSGNPTSVFK